MNKMKLLELLPEKINLEVKYIQIIRNPWDNISAIKMRNSKPLSECIDYFFSHYDGLYKISDKIDKINICKIYYEEFVASPKKHLKLLCDYLGVKYTNDYGEACLKVIFKSYDRLRDKIEWKEEEKERVGNIVKKYDVLKNYIHDS